MRFAISSRATRSVHSSSVDGIAHYCSQVRIKNLQPARKLYYFNHSLILQGIQEVRTEERAQQN
jgi:hypothetical protein